MMPSVITRFWRDERAATAIEYSLIAALIALVVIVGVRAVGTKISARFTSIAVNSL